MPDWVIVHQGDCDASLSVSRCDPAFTGMNWFEFEPSRWPAFSQFDLMCFSVFEDSAFPYLDPIPFHDDLGAAHDRWATDAFHNPR